MIQINVDTSRIKRMQQMVKNIDGGFEKVQSSAISAAANLMKHEIVGATVREYYIDPASVRKTIKITKRKNSVLFKSRGARVPAINFKVSPGKVVTGYTPPYYLLGVKRKKGMQPLNKSRYRKPFLQSKKSSGKLDLYKREGIDRYPLRRFYTSSVPQMMADKDVLEPIQKHAETELYFTIEKEAEKMLGRWKGK